MKRPSTLPSLLAALVCSLSFAALPDARAAQFDIAAPPGSSAFGTSVTVLPNGNFVVTDPGYDLPGVADIGAVYLYDGVTLAVISTLTDSTTGDQVGNGGVTVLANGNYVVRSSALNNGAMNAAGAVTLGDGTLGTTGAVAATNSVLGTVVSGGNSMVFAYDLPNARLLVGYPATNRVILFSYLPEIAVQQHLNVNLADGATRIFGAPVGANASLTFTIRNINVADLTGLGITIEGSDAALFTVTASPTAPVGPFGSTTFR